MPSSLNIQSNREIHYNERCLKKKYDEQKFQRAERAMKRNTAIEEISKEVSNEINSICKKRMSTRNNRSVTNYSRFF